MPKIMDETNDKILAIARRLILEGGYSALAMRTVAAECGIAIGTLYHYYESKEILASQVVRDDWEQTIENMEKRCEFAGNVREMLQYIYDELSAFNSLYRPLFTDKTAQKGYASTVLVYRPLRRKQIANIIRKTCNRFDLPAMKMRASFVAEAMLQWVFAEHDVPELFELLEKLF